eukprot:1722247-Pleurochrysis_carterae.AAC.1
MLGSADFFTDILFAKLAFNIAFAFCNGGNSRQPWLLNTCCAVNVPERLDSCDALAAELGDRGGECFSALNHAGRKCGDPNCDAGFDLPAQCCPELCDSSCNPRLPLVLFAAVVLVAVVLPIVVSQVPLWRVLQQKALLNGEVFREHSVLYTTIIFCSAFNLELLKTLPWRRGSKDYDGFPKQWMLQFSLYANVVEDVPQLVLQGMFIFQIQSSPLDDPVILLAACFSIFSLLWRGFRKLILLQFAPMGTASNSGEVSSSSHVSNSFGGDQRTAVSANSTSGKLNAGFGCASGTPTPGVPSSASVSALSGLAGSRQGRCSELSPPNDSTPSAPCRAALQLVSTAGRSAGPSQQGSQDDSPRSGNRQAREAALRFYQTRKDRSAVREGRDDGNAVANAAVIDDMSVARPSPDTAAASEKVMVATPSLSPGSIEARRRTLARARASRSLVAASQASTSSSSEVESIRDALERVRRSRAELDATRLQSLQRHSRVDAPGSRETEKLEGLVSCSPSRVGGSVSGSPSRFRPTVADLHTDDEGDRSPRTDEQFRQSSDGLSAYQEQQDWLRRTIFGIDASNRDN